MEGRGRGDGGKMEGRGRGTEREGGEKEGKRGMGERERWRLNMTVIQFSINLVSYQSKRGDGAGLSESQVRQLHRTL